MAKLNGQNPYPKVVAELGPGDSLGIGIAALIAGCEKYFAFDIYEFATTENNLSIFDKLVELFRSKSPIPGEDRFPKIKPYLNDYTFPEYIYDSARLQQSLSASRLDHIRKSIIDPKASNSWIKYKVPWYSSSILEKDTVDMIYSQAVLEHIDDIQNAYKSMFAWLKTDGFISHEIDFKCHGLADEWNGHWTYSDIVWKMIKGNRPYLLNRLPYSEHLSMLDKEGFLTVCNIGETSPSKLHKKNLASRFKLLSDQDLTTTDVFIQAVKKP